MDLFSNFKQAMGIDDPVAAVSDVFSLNIRGIMLDSAVVALGMFIVCWLYLIIGYKSGKIKIQGKFFKSKHVEFPFKFAVAVYILMMGIGMILGMYNQFGF